MTSRRSRDVRAPRWTALGAPAVVIAALVGLNSIYMLLVAFGNVTDFTVNQEFVHHVLTMDTTNFGAPARSGLSPNVKWRAVTAVPPQDTIYLCIIVWEGLSGAVLAVACALWAIDRDTGHRKARALSSVGLLMIMLLFVGAFVDIGGEWFQMWKSTTWNGLDSATRVIVMAAIPLILIQTSVAKGGTE
jgi:predicted small integral membrane protein